MLGEERVLTAASVPEALELAIARADEATLDGGAGAGVLVTGTTHLLDEGTKTPSEMLLKAISDSRRLAVENDCEVTLSFNKDARAFTLTSYKTGTGVAAATLPIRRWRQ